MRRKEDAVPTIIELPGSEGLVDVGWPKRAIAD